MPEDLAGRNVRGILGDARPAERGSVSLLTPERAADLVPTSGVVELANGATPVERLYQ